MIIRHAADLVGFHRHSPAQWATMQVHFRWGIWRFDFCVATEPDYFSLHLYDVSQYGADLSGHSANAITPKSNVNAKAGEDFHKPLVSAGILESA